MPNKLRALWLAVSHGPTDYNLSNITDPKCLVTIS